MAARRKDLQALACDLSGVEVVQPALFVEWSTALLSRAGNAQFVWKL